jgi:hypothetical protein
VNLGTARPAGANIARNSSTAAARGFEVLAETLGAFEQARRMALDQVGRDEEQVAARDGGDRGPALPVVEPLGPRFVHAAGDDGLGVGGDDRFDSHRRRHRFELAEDIVTAAQADDVGDDLPAADGHQRLFPDLVEGAHRRQAGRSASADRRAAAKALGRAIGDCFCCRPARRALDLAGDIGEMIGLRQIDRNRQAAQRSRCAAALPLCQAMIRSGLQRGDAFEIEARIAADPGDLLPPRDTR